MGLDVAAVGEADAYVYAYMICARRLFHDSSMFMMMDNGQKLGRHANHINCIAVKSQLKKL